MRNFSFLILISFLFLISGCASKEDLRPKRDCPIEQLLLDQNDYPPGTILDSIRSPIAEKPLESAGVSAYPKDSWASQMVIRYLSIDRATEEYEGSLKRIFDPREVFGSWETPPILDLNNLSVNHHNISCGNVNSFGKRCYMIAQYEEYYVFFRADVPLKGVSYEMFRDWILKIDAEMSACLNQTTN